MLKIIFIFRLLTNHRLTMINKKTCHRFRCLHDLFTLIVLLTLVILLSNYIYSFATSLEKESYSTSVADLKFNIK